MIAITIEYRLFTLPFLFYYFRKPTRKWRGQAPVEQETQHTFTCTQAVLHKTAAEREEQKHLVDKHVETELKLSQQAKKLLAVSDVSTADLKLLRDKLGRTQAVDATNEEVKEGYMTAFNVQSSMSSFLAHAGLVSAAAKSMDKAAQEDIAADALLTSAVDAQTKCAQSASDAFKGKTSQQTEAASFIIVDLK